MIVLSPLNRPGVAALYTSSTHELAVTEAQQGLPLKPQPLTVVSYAIDHDNLPDLSSDWARNEAGVALDELACAWELIASDGNIPPTWSLADRLIAQGIGGLITPSFAVGGPGRRYQHHIPGLAVRAAASSACDR